MENWRISLISAYLIGSCYFISNWFKFFKKNLNSSVEDSFLAIVILVIATVLWPFAVPISLLEILTLPRHKLSSRLAIFLGIVVVSLITLSGLAAFGEAVPQGFFSMFSSNEIQN